ncbi:SCO4225 family membrane protein [Streptomyces cyaneofuscatus]|uniref:SCO4225 family membrane protein n=1 Tax=Streptomyces cyaneofuscatus TaxID=66883 RepID=UPI003419AF62
MTKTSRTLPQTLRHYLVNPPALVYLGIVLGVCLWVAADAFFASSSGDASLVGVWAMLATAPTSLMVPFEGPIALIGIPIGAVVQSFALGAMYRYVTERRALGTANGVSRA